MEYNNNARSQMEDIARNAGRTMNDPALSECTTESQVKRSEVICLSNVGRLEIRWLWEPYIQLGNITIMRGDPGVGKTFFISALMGAVASSVQDPAMPGYLHTMQGKCIYFGNEDDPETIRMRIESSTTPNNCNLNNLFIRTDSVSFQDLDSIRETIIQTGASLVIFDPLQAYLGPKVDMNRANETRPLLENLRRLAKETNCAVLIIEHKNKNQKGDDIYRGIGSMDITAVARSVLMIVRDKDAPNRRYTMQIKTNAKEAPGAVWAITDSGRFTWLGEMDKTLDELREQDEAMRNDAVRLVLAVMSKHSDTWQGSTTDLIEQCPDDSLKNLKAEKIGRALNDPAITDQLERLYNIRVTHTKPQNKSVYTLEHIDR